MEQQNQKNWLDNKSLLILLFFIFPPLGIYGMIKRKTATWKKVIYCLPSGLIGLFIFLAIIVAIFPPDYYKDGIDNYNKKEYTKALYNLRQVKPDDKNYPDAISKIAVLAPIVDSIDQVANIAKEEARLNAKKETDSEKENNLSQPKSETQESTIKNSGTVGETYQVGSLKYKIEKFKFKKFVGGIYSLNKADGVFLIVNLTVTNIGKQEVLIDNSFFKLTDNGGATYEYSPDATASIEMSEFPGETFLGMALNPNVSKKAKVVFEVPSKKKAYSLVFSDWTSDNELTVSLQE